MKSKTTGLVPHTEFLWSREDYEDLVRQGVFGPEDKIELLDGKLITMAPQNSRHRTALNLARVYLDEVFADGAHVSIQSPLSLGVRSQPEPDLAVVPGAIRDYSDAHPSTALLVVEVSDSSLAYDRGTKLAAYSRAVIPEYWIINLVEEVVEIYRKPRGEGYEDCTSVPRGTTLHPASHPDHEIDAADLLP